MTALGHLRRSARSLQFLQPCSYNVRTSLRLFLRKESSFVPKRVLIVAKLSRYYFEQLREPELTESQLKAKLLERGSDYEGMLAGHIATRDVERQVTEVLRKMNIEYRIINRQNLDQRNFAWADLVLPIGGDGTFLLASNLIFNNRKPIIGINSHPEKSEGFLMLPPKYRSMIPEVFEMLKAGDYRVVLRTRIRTTLKGDTIWDAPFHTHEKGRVAGGEKFYTQSVEGQQATNNLAKERRLPWLALNEVFLAESLSARTSTLLVNIDDQEKYYLVKGSGLCVCTGTGSTSWYKSITSVNTEIVQKILNLVDDERKFTDQEIERICSVFNSSLLFDAEELKLRYVIRDMIMTDVWPVPKTLPPYGSCLKFTARSQCFDAGLVLDGGIAVPFKFGTTAVMEVHPEDSLRTLDLPD